MSQPSENEADRQSAKVKASLAGALVLALIMTKFTMGMFRAESRSSHVYDRNVLSPETAWIFERPEQFTLLSLRPFAELRRWSKGKTNAPVTPSSLEQFHEHEVLGKASITNRTEQLELYGAITNGLRALEGNRFPNFDPRYAVRIQREGKTVDLILSFECRTAEEVLGEKRELTISSAPAEVFKRAFDRHGLLLDTNDFFGIYARE